MPRLETAKQVFYTRTVPIQTSQFWPLVGSNLSKESRDAIHGIPCVKNIRDNIYVRGTDKYNYD